MVKLEQGMKYSTSEHFGRNIYRHLRFAHPTYIYGDLSFEIDKDGISQRFVLKCEPAESVVMAWQKR